MSRGLQRRSVRLRDYDYTQTGAYFVTICTRERRLFFQRDAVRAIAERCWLEMPGHFPRVVLDEWVVMPNHVHGIIVIGDPNDDSIVSHANVRRRISDDDVDPHRDDGEPNAPHRRGVQLSAPTANFIDDNAARRHGDAGVDPRRNDDDSSASHRRGVQLNAPTANFIDGNANHRNIVRNSTNRHSLISPHRNTLAVIVRTYKAAVTTLCRRAGCTYFEWQRSYYERIIRDDAEFNRVRQYIMDNPLNWTKDEYHAR